MSVSLLLLHLPPLKFPYGVVITLVIFNKIWKCQVRWKYPHLHCDHWTHIQWKVYWLISSSEELQLNWQGAVNTTEHNPLLVGSHSPHLQQSCPDCIFWDPTSGVVLQLPNYVSLNITFSSSNFFFISRYLSSEWDNSSLSLITSASKHSIILSWGVATYYVKNTM